MTYYGPRPTIVAVDAIEPTGRADRPWRVRVRIRRVRREPRRWRWLPERTVEDLVAAEYLGGDDGDDWIVEGWTGWMHPPNQNLLGSVLWRFRRDGEIPSPLWGEESVPMFGKPPPPLDPPAREETSP